MKDHSLFQRGDNKEIAKYIYNFKILLQNSGLVSTKLGAKHPWVKGFKVCSTEGPYPFPRSDNIEIVNIH